MSKKKKKVREVAFDALREMYSKAEPPLDFDDVRENTEEYEDDWYQNHSLPRDKQREIVDKHCEKHNLSEDEQVAVHWTAILDLGPAHKGDNNE